MQLSADLALNASGETLEQIAKAEALEILSTIEIYSYIRTVIVFASLVILAGACWLGAPILITSVVALLFAGIAIFTVESYFSDPRVDALCEKLAAHLAGNATLGIEIRSLGTKGVSIFRGYEKAQNAVLDSQVNY